MKAKAFTLETLTLLVNHLQSSNRLMDIRNRALLLIGFFGAFRCSELVAIQKEHLNFVKEGVEIIIPRSKTDTEGEGEVCAILGGNNHLCPVTALKIWCEKVPIETGRFFDAFPRVARY